MMMTIATASVITTRGYQIHAQVSTEAQATKAQTIYVAPDGKPENSGLAESPLDLATALKPKRVSPGNTILLRGGTYTGPFRSDLTGTESAPITMRSAPGENAMITSYQSRGDGGVLNVYGAWAIYRDFEVTDSSRDRFYGTKFRPMGINILAPHTRFINLVVHDAGHGFGFWKEAIDSELYGNIIFNNGTENSDSDMRHGHAIYAQNSDGEKVIRDNVMFDQYGWGIHAYPSPGGVTGFRIEGNVSFNNGLASHARRHYNNILVSGHRPFKTDRIVIRNNFAYFPPGQTSTGKFTDANLCLGCSDAETNGEAEVTGNYLVNGSPVILASGWQHLTMTGNTVAGNGLLVSFTAAGRSGYTVDRNHYFGGNADAFSFNGSTVSAQGWRANGFDTNSSFANGLPSGIAVFVRPNQYEPGRANIIVYNWNHAPYVSADVSNVLHPGAHYRVFNVQNLAGRPVAEGAYSGNAISLPMAAPPVATPLGAEQKVASADLSSSPEFAVFLLRTVDGAEVERPQGRATSAARPGRSNTGVRAGAPVAGPDPLAKLRPFEGEYASLNGSARAVITADNSGLSIRILTEKGAPEYRITQESGPRFRIEGLPRGFYVDFAVEGDRVNGITLDRGPLPKVFLSKR